MEKLDKLDIDFDMKIPTILNKTIQESNFIESFLSVVVGIEPNNPQEITITTSSDGLNNFVHSIIRIYSRINIPTQSE